MAKKKDNHHEDPILDDPFYGNDPEVNGENDGEAPRSEDGNVSDPGEWQAEVAELKNKYLRLYAEFDNFKKRTLKEKIEMSKRAGQDVLLALLPVLDDFDRAKAIADNPDNEEYFSEGVELVYNKLQQVLKNQGLLPMDTEDREFNPELHDAIADIPVEDENLKGRIIDFIEKGYLLNDRILRHAKVVVGKK